MEGAASPYRGLAPYRAGDAPLFFGRAELIRELVGRLSESPALVIAGPSGAGKSSLLQAGLLPALGRGALPGSRGWGTSLLTPGSHPLDTLWSRLGDLAGKPLPDIYALAEAPAAAAARAIGAGVVAVDRLEELFIACSDRAEREAFLGLLEELSSGDAPRIRVILCVRADFYPECAGHPWLASTINRNQVLIGGMTPAGLREAVEGPARERGLRLEDGLAERVLGDAGDDPGALPRVSHALFETWTRRRDTTLTLAGYEQSGGVADAINRTAERVWDGLDASRQEAARRLLLQLIAERERERAAPTGRSMSWTEIAAGGPAREAVSALAEARLLTVDERGVELAHEVLVRHWSRLREWLEEERDESRIRQRLEAAAREWAAGGRERSLLLRGLPLANALEWRARTVGGLGEPLGSFLSAGEEAREAVLRAEAARREREGRARRRTVTRLRVLAAALAAGLIVALILLARAGGGSPGAHGPPRLGPAAADSPLISTHSIRVLI